MIEMVGWMLAALALAPPQDGEKKDAPSKETRTAYVRRMFAKDRASHGDACRAVLSLVKGEHTDEEFAKIQEQLAGEGIVNPSWELEESSLVTKGTIAYMLCKALRIKGGLTMMLAGTNRRYALREAIYVGLIRSGTMGEYMSGRELIDVLSNAEIYKKEGNLDSIRK